MIVGEMMTTRLVVVTPGSTLAHAANILREHQFHHLPVVRMSAATIPWEGVEQVIDTQQTPHTDLPVLEGLLDARDIEEANAVNAARLEGNAHAGAALPVSWQERRVAEVMQPVLATVTATTSLASAAHVLVERGLDCLPVVAYPDAAPQETPPTLLAGLITRSDLLLAFARALGADEPGVELHLPCAPGDVTPLARTLLLASELHIPVRSCLAAPLTSNRPHVVTLRLGTIYPAPLLLRLRQMHIQYRLTGEPAEEQGHD